MRLLLLALGEVLLCGAALLLWLRHHLLVAQRRWERRQSRWRRRFATVLHRLAGTRPVPPKRWWRGGRNRTAPEVEEQLCRLAVERRDVGLRGLRVLFARVEGVLLGVTTVRAILLRRRTLLAELEASRKEKRRIRIRRAGVLWGVDLTLVWLWGVVPVWLLGVVDYHGSRVLHLAPTARGAAAVARTLSALVEVHGAPEAVLTDNGGEFRAEVVDEALRRFGVKHRFIRPGHAWTNGRIERVFGTLKRLCRRYARTFVSPGHLRRFCADFVLWHNACRPHASYWGLTPDEVARGEAATAPVGVVSLFDGQLLGHRFT